MKAKKKILIIDDSPIDREMATMMLKKNGFDVASLSSGKKCFEMIEMDRPDIILLDVMIPDENGNDTLRKLRDRFSAVELPIIMVTSNTEATDVIHSLNLGANDYITKPVEYDVAIKRIETHLKISELSHEMSRLKELEAVKAIVATYNHEINNPLTIAIGKLDLIRINQNAEENLKEAEKALWRISDIIKKIQKILQAQAINYEEYDKHCDMLNLNK